MSASKKILRCQALSLPPGFARWIDQKPDWFQCVLQTQTPNEDHRFDVMPILAGEALDFNQWLQQPLNDAPVQWQMLEQPNQQHVAVDPARLPFTGGWLFYLGYEFAQQVEPRLHLSTSELPDTWFVPMAGALIYDHHQQQLVGVADMEQRLAFDTIWQWVCKQGPNDGAVAVPGSIAVERFEEDDPQRFLSGVARIQSYILAGDVFQVNLSRGWQLHVPTTVKPVDLFHRLQHTNPAPFAVFWQTPDWSIISSSPERLIRIQDNIIETRPIAGTRKRSKDAMTDAALKQALLDHPKEQAEHVMLIDLERNDLGRVAQMGSVSVTELMTVETYAHVHHIVSNVSGRLPAGTHPADCLRATFPGGTITGCPKVRCMEIIQELEAVARGPYTGTIGYINHDGSMDSNILIRTLWQQGQTVTFRTGAGIVADSDPEFELAETRHKAKGLLQLFDLTDLN